MAWRSATHSASGRYTFASCALKVSDISANPASIASVDVRPLSSAYAREAVNRAKSSPHHVNVVGSDPRVAQQVETVLWLMASVLRRRSDRGWAVADLLAEGLTRREIGVKLGISQSAVTQRAQAAGFAEEQRGRVLAAELLDAGAAA